MFNELLDLVRPVFLTDPVFGRLRFQRVGLWEGSVEFPPVGGTVEVLVDADRSGPSEDQRRLLRELIGMYPALWSPLKSSLNDAIAGWHSGAGVTEQTYRLVAITIPVATLATEGCLLGFEAAPAGLHLSVAVRGSQVGEVLVEC